MVAQRGDCTAQNETLRKEIEVCGMGGVWGGWSVGEMWYGCVGVVWVGHGVTVPITGHRM